VATAIRDGRLNNVVNTSTGVKEYNVDMAAAIIAPCRRSWSMPSGQVFRSRLVGRRGEGLTDGEHHSQESDEAFWFNGGHRE